MDGTDATQVREMLDRLFRGRTLVPRDEVLQEAESADVSEEVLGYVRDLPPGHYGYEELRQRLIGPITVDIPTEERGMTESPEARVPERGPSGRPLRR